MCVVVSITYCRPTCKIKCFCATSFILCVLCLKRESYVVENNVKMCWLRYIINYYCGTRELHNNSTTCMCFLLKTKPTNRIKNSARRIWTWKSAHTCIIETCCEKDFGQNQMSCLSIHVCQSIQCFLKTLRCSSLPIRGRSIAPMSHIICVHVPVRVYSLAIIVKQIQNPSFLWSMPCKK